MKPNGRYFVLKGGRFVEFQKADSHEFNSIVRLELRFGISNLLSHARFSKRSGTFKKRIFNKGESCIDTNNRAINLLCLLGVCKVGSCNKAEADSKGSGGSTAG